MKTKAKLFSSILLLLAGAAPGLAAGAGILFNEIMYHPASTNVLEEWIELYNSGPTNVNLSGWQITKGVQFAFPTNTTIAAGGYLVVAANIAAFAAKYPGVTNVRVFGGESCDVRRDHKVATRGNRRVGGEGELDPFGDLPTGQVHIGRPRIIQLDPFLQDVGRGGVIHDLVE